MARPSWRDTPLSLLPFYCRNAFLGWAVEVPYPIHHHQQRVFMGGCIFRKQGWNSTNKTKSLQKGLGRHQFGSLFCFVVSGFGRMPLYACLYALAKLGVSSWFIL